MGTDNPYVKAFGSATENSSTIIIMNQDSSKTFAFDFNKINLNPADNKLVITSSNPMKANYSGNIEPSTTLLFVFDGKGAVQKQLIYNLDLAIKNMPPKLIK